ncbi:MAG TPA: efflux RND transporter periplasmic adaptor subunit [Candidatus Moranbacteria bacterium]|nr:efflux RND transporter periplasmic adaptor subunit [Candidatus Moranbacteria bacterium]
MKIFEILKKKKIIAIVFIVIIAGGYYWYNKNNSSNNNVQYVTQAAAKENLTTSITGSGNVIVDQSANIDPTITGTVAGLAVNVGDKVTKGQLLFTIDNDDLHVNMTKARVSYLQALQSLESAKATKKEAKSNYNDASSSEKSILKQKLEAAEASVISTEENVRASLENYQNERANYTERNVTSPINGTVNEVNIKNGDDLSKLSSGSSREVPIIIGDLSTMKAQVQINEVDIANVIIGQEATLTFSAIDGLTATGKVEQMDSLGTLSSGVVTYNVTISFDSLDSRIKPEMSVSADIITAVKQNAIVVPNSAIKTQNGKNYVEILNNGNAVPNQATVQTGASNNTSTEIISGVNVGDKVVTQTKNSASASSTSSNSRGGMRMPGL